MTRRAPWLAVLVVAANLAFTGWACLHLADPTVIVSGMGVAAWFVGSAFTPQMAKERPKPVGKPKPTNNPPYPKPQKPKPQRGH